jgi:hypothetical protein
VIKWNRQIEKMLSQIGTASKGTDVTPPDLLLRKIGKEIYDGLPAMLSGAGFKPMDQKTVYIMNLSSYDLQNIRVHFLGCTGFDSYETWPDAFGSAENRNLLSSRPTDPVTLRYDSLPRVFERSYRQATVTFYGTDASQCKPIVEAVLAKGSTAVGKEVNIDSYMNDISWSRYRKEQLGDLGFKVFLAAAVLYIYFQIRSLKKRIRQEG